jgi:hypothetical protein
MLSTMGRRIFRLLHAAFHRSDTTVYQWLNWVVWVLIVVSVGIFVVDVAFELGDTGWIAVADRVVLWLFVVEFTLRFISYRPPPPLMRLFSSASLRA